MIIYHIIFSIVLIFSLKHLAIKFLLLRNFVSKFTFSPLDVNISFIINVVRRRE